MTQLLTIVKNWLDTNGNVIFPLPITLTKPYQLVDRIIIKEEITGEGLWCYNLITHGIWLVFVYKNNFEAIKSYLPYADHVQILIDESNENHIDYEEVEQLGLGVLSINTKDGEFDVADRISVIKMSKLQYLDDNIRFCYASHLPTELKRPWWAEVIKNKNKNNDLLEKKPVTEKSVTQVPKNELWEKIKNFVESKTSLEVDNPEVILDYLDQAEIIQFASITEQTKIREELSKFYESDLTHTTLLLQKLGFGRV